MKQKQREQLEEVALEFYDLIHTQNGKELWQFVYTILNTQIAYEQATPIDIEYVNYPLRCARRDGKVAGLEWLIEEAAKLKRTAETAMEK